MGAPRQRLHLGIAHADVVGQEDHVELAALGGLRDLDVMFEVDAGVGLCARRPPRRDMVAGGVEEGAEAELGGRSGHDGSSSANLSLCIDLAQALPLLCY